MPLMRFSAVTDSVNLMHYGVFAVIDIPVYHGEAEIAYIRVGGDAAYVFFGFLKLFGLGDFGMNIGYRIG